MLNKIKRLLRQEETAQVQDSNAHSDLTETEISIFNWVKPFTMTSIERVKVFLDAIQYVSNSNIPGDIVECGVWKGGSVMAAILQLNRLERKRNLWLYDTFEGMSEPTDSDEDNRGRKALDRLQKEDKYTSNVWAYSTLEEVKKNIEKINSSKLNLNYIKGKVEDTLQDQSNIPNEIAILRLDTDWYESTKAELEILYPRVQKGGVVIIDDYGHWKGCKKAVDEFIENNDLQIFLTRVDYTCRVFVKS
jgi:hypothetical protein